MAGQLLWRMWAHGWLVCLRLLLLLALLLALLPQVLVQLPAPLQMDPNPKVGPTTQVVLDVRAQTRLLYLITAFSSTGQTIPMTRKPRRPPASQPDPAPTWVLLLILGGISSLPANFSESSVSVWNKSS